MLFTKGGWVPEIFHKRIPPKSGICFFESFHLWVIFRHGGVAGGGVGSGEIRASRDLWKLPKTFHDYSNHWEENREESAKAMPKWDQNNLIKGSFFETKISQNPHFRDLGLSRVQMGARMAKITKNVSKIIPGAPKSDPKRPTIHINMFWKKTKSPRGSAHLQHKTCIHSKNVRRRF